MALTFKFFLDSALTTPLAGPLLSEHLVDGSEPQDEFTIYFGSAAAGKKAEANSNPGVDQIAVTPTPVVAAWAAATAKSVGDIVRPTAHNGYRYKSIVGGATGGAQPTWPTTIGSTVVDGGVTWQCESEINDITDVKLAATQGGLAGATWGAALNLGTSVLSGAANAKPVWIKVRDSTLYVQNTDLQVKTNIIKESAQ